MIIMKYSLCTVMGVVTYMWVRKLVSTFSPMINLHLQVLSLVIEYDVNGNGKLDFDEFMEMMRKQVRSMNTTRNEGKRNKFTLDGLIFRQNTRITLQS